MSNLYTAILEQIGVPNLNGRVYSREALESAIKKYNRTHRDTSVYLKGDIMHIDVLKPIIIPGEIKSVTVTMSPDFDDVDPKHLVHQHIKDVKL